MNNKTTGSIGLALGLAIGHAATPTKQVVVDLHPPINPSTIRSHEDAQKALDACREVHGRGKGRSQKAQPKVSVSK